MRALGSWPDVRSWAISLRSCFTWLSRLLRISLIRAVANLNSVLLCLHSPKNIVCLSYNACQYIPAKSCKLQEHTLLVCLTVNAQHFLQHEGDNLLHTRSDFFSLSFFSPFWNLETFSQHGLPHGGSYDDALCEQTKAFFPHLQPETDCNQTTTVLVMFLQQQQQQKRALKLLQKFLSSLKIEEYN